MVPATDVLILAAIRFSASFAETMAGRRKGRTSCVQDHGPKGR